MIARSRTARHSRFHVGISYLAAATDNCIQFSHDVAARRQVDTEAILAVVNPAAGSGRAESIWQRASLELERRGIAVRTVVTRARGHAATLVEEARRDGYTTFAAVGGDGTVHEVVNGLLDDTGIDPGVRLAVVQAGTGMDFARNLGLGRGLRAAVGRILAGKERHVDVGFVPSERRSFVNFMETGLGAAVVAREARLSDAWPGRASFLVAAVGAAMTERNVRIQVSADGIPIYAGCAVSVVVANGQYFGGGMKIAPVARIDDGLLDLMILGDFGRLELVRQIWKIYPGAHLAHRKVLHVRARSVSIQAPDSALLDLDGELGGNPSTTVRLLPSALRVLV